MEHSITNVIMSHSELSLGDQLHRCLVLLGVLHENANVLLMNNQTRNFALHVLERLQLLSTNHPRLFRRLHNTLSVDISNVVTTTILRMLPELTDAEVRRILFGLVVHEL